jgi:hypothetical protein
MTRTSIISDIIRANNYTTYLEVGVATGENIRRIVTIPGVRVVGVDPAPLCEHVTHPVDSDAFFRDNRQTFDIIFIDGCHIEEQVDKDVVNALSVLNRGGTIVMHDCNPATYEHATNDWLLAEWNGTVWRSAVKIRCTNDAVTLRVVDTDYGCGILTRGASALYTKADIATCLSWDYFAANRGEILNLISCDEFARCYLSGVPEAELSR